MQGNGSKFCRDCVTLSAKAGRLATVMTTNVLLAAHQRQLLDKHWKRGRSTVAGRHNILNITYRIANEAVAQALLMPNFYSQSDQADERHDRPEITRY